MPLYDTHTNIAVITDHPQFTLKEGMHQKISELAEKSLDDKQPGNDLIEAQQNFNDYISKLCQQAFMSGIQFEKEKHDEYHDIPTNPFDGPKVRE